MKLYRAILRLFMKSRHTKSNFKLLMLICLTVEYILHITKNYKTLKAKND